MSNVHYVVVDGSSGRIVETVSVPESMFPLHTEEHQKIVVITDRSMPVHHQYVVDLGMLIDKITIAAKISDIVNKDERPPDIPPALDVLIAEKILEVDNLYAERLAEIAGPLAALHAEKRRQAEAGGGPLVADEADRLAILANAAAQDEAVAAIERERRELKALLRAANSRDELAAIEASLKR